MVEDHLFQWYEGLQELSAKAGFGRVHWRKIITLTFNTMTPRVADPDLQCECLLKFLQRWNSVVAKYDKGQGTPDEFLYRCFRNSAMLTSMRMSTRKRVPEGGAPVHLSEWPLVGSFSSEDVLVRFAAYLEGMGYHSSLAMFRHLMRGGVLTTFSRDARYRKDCYLRLHRLAENWLSSV